MGNYDLDIWAYARVDTVKEEMVTRLKLAGFNWLGFGIGAASKRVRDDVDEGFAQDTIFRTLDMVREGGINVAANYIVGLPEDSVESVKVSLNLALGLKIE